MREIAIPVGGGAAVSASLHGETGETLAILGHGAGGDRRSPFMVRLAEALAAGGRRALLYNFPYKEAGRRVPDPPARLEATVAAVDRHARETLGVRHVVHGGKSMGGRIASQAVAGGLSADALVFVGYPLHPPGKPEKLRDAHLGRIGVPMLFLQGTRDAFAEWERMASVVQRLGPGAHLYRVEGGDHSFKVLKKSGRSGGEVEAEIQAAIVRFLDDALL